jgi:hypothetical protein
MDQVGSLSGDGWSRPGAPGHGPESSTRETREGPSWKRPKLESGAQSGGGGDKDGRTPATLGPVSSMAYHPPAPVLSMASVAMPSGDGDDDEEFEDG